MVINMTVRTFSYNEFEKIIEQSKETLVNYVKKHNIKFDYILSASKEDHIFNSMLSVDLDIESLFLNKMDDCFKIKDVLDKIKNTKNTLNILLVQSIFNEQDNIDLSEILKKSNLYVLAAFANNNEINNKSVIEVEKLIIVNETKTNDIKMPWDRSQFTPLNQLEKFQDIIRVNINQNNKYFFGFSSSDFKREFDIYFPEWKKVENISFQEQSEFNEVKKQNLFYKINSIQEYEILNKDIIANKITFIEENGITEYIEENLIQAIILSSKIKVARIIFLEDGKLYAFNSNVVKNLA